MTAGRTHVSVRLEDEHIARVDALAPRFSTKYRVATRSDVLRGLILESLDVFEAEAPEAAPATVPAQKRRKRGAR
jgi:hypothetical protein